MLQLHTFKGPHWCDFCANFLWGLIAQGVKCQGTASALYSLVTKGQVHFIGLRPHLPYLDIANYVTVSTTRVSQLL